MSPRSAVNRNDPCPCGSGLKYKKCCLGKPGAPGSAAEDAKPGTPTGPRALLARATAMHRAGRLDEAAKLYARVLERRPREADALAGLGRIRGHLGDHDEGLALLRRAIAADGSRADYHVSLGALLHLARDEDAALRAARRAVALDPKLAAAHSLEASCHDRRNRLDEALASARRALELAPDDANASMVMAGLQRRSGDHDAARAALEALVARPAVQGSLLQEALTELGMTLDTLGLYDEAYEAFRACGAETARDPAARRIDGDLLRRRVAHYKAGLTPELIGRWRHTRDDRPPPAFLVGFSRSGTTLTEQVMAAHPDIVTSNERPVIRNTRREMIRMGGGGEDLPALMDRLDADQVTHLRAVFWREAERFAEADLAGKVFVHKQPLNTIDVGFINFLFPDGRLLMALRDPRDVCLSCFQQLFTINAANVNFLSLESTTRFYAEVMDLWLHVREMLTMENAQIRYEDTVTDLDMQARRILDLLGVTWDDDVLRFHEKARDRHIATPSYAAVTGPVSTKAIGRWKNYLVHFEPHLERLARFVAAFGYG
jgi:tetratricopeptide (TPR) repeat protein